MAAPCLVCITCVPVVQSSLVGSKLYIFGGEDASRRALGDLHILNLPTMTWERTSDAAPGNANEVIHLHFCMLDSVWIMKHVPAKPPSS
jgi:hypothetical protein